MKNYSRLIAGIAIGLVIGYFIGNHQNREHSFDHGNNTAAPQVHAREISADSIPGKVFEVLKYIRANHHAMDGYVGGRVFTNREKIVPQKNADGNPIQYQEWDVNPKVRGQNRGPERILTGSDGRAWYTSDHYRSFSEIK